MEVQRFIAVQPTQRSRTDLYIRKRFQYLTFAGSQLSSAVGQLAGAEGELVREEIEKEREEEKLDEFRKTMTPMHWSMRTFSVCSVKLQLVLRPAVGPHG